MLMLWQILSTDSASVDSLSLALSLSHTDTHTQTAYIMTFQLAYQQKTTTKNDIILLLPLILLEAEFHAVQKGASVNRI